MNGIWNSNGKRIYMQEVGTRDGLPSQIVKAGRRLDLHHVPADFDAIRERALARDL